MKNKGKHTNRPVQRVNKQTETALPGYPLYPANDDIFSRSKEETGINPEDTSQTKVLNDKAGKNNEKDFEEDKSGSDLDVPGSELDDEQENVGREDEENNYYSLGGDGRN